MKAKYFFKTLFYLFGTSFVYRLYQFIQKRLRQERIVVIESGQKVTPLQFKGQKDIKKVILLKGAIVGQQAFEDCTGIKELVIANDVTILSRGFSGCSSISDIVVSKVSCVTGFPTGLGLTAGPDGIIHVNIGGVVGIQKNITDPQGFPYGKSFSFDTVRRFEKSEPICYLARQLRLSLPEFFELFGNSMQKYLAIKKDRLVSHKGIYSLQSLCLTAMVTQERLRDRPVAKVINHWQQLLATAELDHLAHYKLEQDDQLHDDQFFDNTKVAQILSSRIAMNN